MTDMNTRRILIAVLLLGLAGFSARAIRAAEPASTTLSSDARQAMKKGLIAAEQQEWNLAIRYFEEARKATPSAPEIFFNLGLAESKVPGRELRSIAWFNAYLAAGPDAANAPAVRDVTDQLEVKVEGAVDRILRQAKQVAGSFPEEYNRYTAYGRVFSIMAGTGNPAGAKQEAMALSADEGGSALAGIARALAVAGDVNGAREIADRIKNEVWKSVAFESIAVVQAAAGDIPGARLTLENSTHIGYKHSGLIAIARALYKEGKKDEAYQTLAQARDIIVQRKASDKNEYCSEFHTIAKAQMEIGDLDGALQTALLLVQADKSIFDYQYDLIDDLGEAYQARVNEKLKVGDTAAAREAAGKNPSRYAKFFSYLALKDYDTCAAMIEQFDDSYPWKFELYARLVTALFDEGKTGPAGQIAERAKSNLTKMDPQTIADFAGALVKIKDLAGAGRTLPLIPKDALTRNSILKSYVEELVKARRLAEARQAVSTIQDDSDKIGALQAICLAQLADKDNSGALQTASLMPDSYNKRSFLWELVDKYLADNDPANAGKVVALMVGEAKQSPLKQISEHQRKAGDIEGARLTAMQISDAYYRSEAFSEIAQDDADRGDFIAAATSAAAIPKDARRADAFLFLALKQRDRGYTVLAEESLRKARETAERMSDPLEKLETYNKIVAYTVDDNAAWHEASRAIVLSAGSVADTIADPEKRSEAFLRNWWGYDVRSSRERVGLFADYRQSFQTAIDAALLMKKDNANRLGTIASSQVWAGDIMGGLETAALTGSREQHQQVLVLAAKVKVMAGDIPGALVMVKEISSKNDQDDIYLAVVTRQVELNDLPGANRTRISIVGEKKDNAAEAVARAYLKAGDVAAAREVVSTMKQDPGSMLFEEMVKAGALDWAGKIIGSSKNTYSRDLFQSIMARAQAKSGDLAGAKKTAGLITNEGNKSGVYLAVAEAGDISWALANAATLKDETSRVYARTGIAGIAAGNGDIAAARDIIRTVKAEKLSVASRLTVARAQVRIGDTTGAIETLVSVHGRDAEFEAWSSYQIATGIDSKDTARWREAAERVRNDELKSKVYLYHMLYLKDKKLVRDLAAAVPDTFQQSQLYLRLSGTAIRDGDLQSAAELAGLITDNDYRLLALGRVTLAAVNRGDPAVMRPYIQALPDSAAKIWMLKDISRTPAEAALLVRKISDMAVAAAPVAAAPAVPVLAVRNEKLEKWILLVDRELNTPLFMDLPGYIQSLTTKTAAGEIFDGLLDAASTTFDMLKRMKSMQ